LSAMLLARDLKARRHVDRLALDEGDNGALVVALLAENAPEALRLALADERVDRLDLDLEQGLDRRLDLALGGAHGDVEDHLVLLGRGGRALGDHRAADDVVVAERNHLNRSVSASTAALVSTRVSRRMMS